ncbi:DUF2235 domain-containing protein [Lysobacter korlensis]|uniref:DUF2235 domain-containing protein n=1 Tax=Lysobacter korlensis TaxID=553636 RepID=A0ABV6S0M9_9GAMM
MTAPGEGQPTEGSTAGPKAPPEPAARSSNSLVLGRNLVICLDGTNNEPETGVTNVARLYEVAVKQPDQQLVYYDPGVGTMGARGAVTRWGKMLTRFAGLIAGFGIKDNIEEAYTWLADNYRRGDQVYVFGFSRGAYTARALTGMLRTVGLLRPGTSNLAPYALKLYAQTKGANSPRAAVPPEQRSAKPVGPPPESAASDAEKAFWRMRDSFTDRFGNPDFPHPFDRQRPQVHFLGVWDTVKSVGWLNWKARIEQARWPFTARITNVGIARHAMSIDETRFTFPIYRFDGDAVRTSDGRYKELWFAGIHSDVGGQYDDDHALSDVAFAWMVDEAKEAGLLVDDKVLDRVLQRRGIPIEERALGLIHRNGMYWWILGGWRARVIYSGDELHESVWRRMDRGQDAKGRPYRPALPHGLPQPRSKVEGRGGGGN